VPRGGTIEDVAGPTLTLVDAGRAALRRGDGAAAHAAFLEALERERSGAVLDGLGHATCLLRELDAAMDWWHAAYAAYREEGDGVGAARVARNVAYLHGSYAGDWAVAHGWLSRAQRQVPADDPSSERGWVALTAGMFEPDRGRKHVRFLEAIEVGRSRGDAELAFAGQAYYGASLVHAERLEEGMVLLDEALAAVAGGEVEDQVVVEEIFCQLFSACEQAHDVSRAEQWMRVGEDLARRRNLPNVAAYCHTHFGGLMTAAGRWPEAEEALTEGVRLWALGRRRLQNGALARLAELRVRQGRLDEATRLLEGLDADDECVRPRAALLLALGRVTEAVEVVERRLAAVEPVSTEAVPLLALLVEAHLAVGAIEEAEEAAAALSFCVAGRPGQWLRATAALARGRVALARGDGQALAELRFAADAFSRAQFPLELARSRMELAAACAADRPEVALAEARAAYDAFERLHAARQVDAAAALLRTLGVKVGSAQPDGGRLTQREREILTLIGEGLTNPEIATRLFISRKTVEHHVGHVLAKLGLRSRSEAAAYSARAKQGTG